VKHNKNIWLLLVFIFLSLFWGCKEGALRLSIRYDTLGELQSKVPVYFGKTEIGQVDKIVSTDAGDYLVEVSIYPNHKDKATDNSKFFILDDPFVKDRMAIVVEQEPPGGKILEPGSIVQGEKPQGLWDGFVRGLKKSTKEASETMHSLKETISGNTHRLNEQLEKSLDDIDKSFQDFSDSVNKALNSDDMENLKKSIRDFIEQFKSSSKELQDYMRAEVLPKLQKSLEALRDRLKHNGQNDEAEEIDQQIDELVNV